MKRRQCQRCLVNRDPKFYKTARGRVCITCQSKRGARATRAVRIQETYGLTTADYEALLAAQGGCCAICKGNRTYNLDVDHDHALEKLGWSPRDCVRGLLCRQCNRRVLRSVRDDRRILLAAINYLRDPPARNVLDRIMVVAESQPHDL